MHSETVENATITVAATASAPFTTTEGQGCVYEISLDTLDHNETGSIALGSGTPGQVEPLTWAVVVESTLLGVLPGTDDPVPGSRDSAPMQSASTRDWVTQHRHALKRRCGDLRG